MPTSYKGLAELGLIAGCGMVIAYATSHIGATKEAGL
jgi:hypothetical protein